MKDLPGLHGDRSVGPSMPLGISGEILETILAPWGTTGVVPAGPLLAVLAARQQGCRGAFRHLAPTVTRSQALSHFR